MLIYSTATHNPFPPICLLLQYFLLLSPNGFCMDPHIFKWVCLGSLKEGRVTFFRGEFCCLQIVRETESDTRVKWRDTTTYTLNVSHKNKEILLFLQIRLPLLYCSSVSLQLLQLHCCVLNVFTAHWRFYCLNNLSPILLFLQSFFKEVSKKVIISFILPLLCLVSVKESKQLKVPKIIQSKTKEFKFMLLHDTSWSICSFWLLMQLVLVL